MKTMSIFCSFAHTDDITFLNYTSNNKMDTINSSRKIFAPIDKVWSIIADVDNDPKYWAGINSVNNLNQKDNIIEREVTLGFRNTKGHQIVTLNPKNSITIKLTQGPIIGNKITRLLPIGDDRTTIDVSWEIEKFNVPFIAKNIIQKQLLTSTKEALDKIAKAVE